MKAQPLHRGERQGAARLGEEVGANERRIADDDIWPRRSGGPAEEVRTNRARSAGGLRVNIHAHTLRPARAQVCKLGASGRQENAFAAGRVEHGIGACAHGPACERRGHARRRVNRAQHFFTRPVLAITMRE